MARAAARLRRACWARRDSDGTPCGSDAGPCARARPRPTRAARSSRPRRGWRGRLWQLAAARRRGVLEELQRLVGPDRRD
jgi:hypothetical protein